MISIYLYGVRVRDDLIAGVFRTGRRERPSTQFPNEALVRLGRVCALRRVMKLANIQDAVRHAEGGGPR